jgi:hypothetical protein
MDENKLKVKCDECGYEFDIRTQNIKSIENVKVENTTICITYFKCEKCNKIYIVEMLDYKAQKLKNRYLAIADSVHKKLFNKKTVSDVRMQELEKVKKDAIDYQHWLIDRYKDTTTQWIKSKLTGKNPERKEKEE